MRPYELTVAAAAAAIATGELSPVELTASVLDRVAEVEPGLNAYVAVRTEAARRAAERAERERAAGR
ncbi:Asp-tRNA(Asn)/Glu-tRNA(Gln) amidotransferase GatCAB subunit A, partial [Streptomyces spectabilis]